jgi:hypothetical protein
MTVEKLFVFLLISLFSFFLFFFSPSFFFAFDVVLFLPGQATQRANTSRLTKESGQIQGKSARQDPISTTTTKIETKRLQFPIQKMPVLNKQTNTVC